MQPAEEVTIICPYCGESFGSVIDCTAGEQDYVEDCFVCCQPIAIHVVIDADGRPLVTASIENG